MELILLQKVKNLGEPRRQGQRQAGLRPQLPRPAGQGRAGDRRQPRRVREARAEYEAKATPAARRRRRAQGATRGRHGHHQGQCEPEGKLFGSVGPRDIAEAFTAAGTRWRSAKWSCAKARSASIGEFEVQCTCTPTCRPWSSRDRARGLIPTCRSAARGGGSCFPNGRPRGRPFRFQHRCATSPAGAPAGFGHRLSTGLLSRQLRRRHG